MRQVWICAVALLGVLAIAGAAAAAPTDQISVTSRVHVSQRTIYDVHDQRVLAQARDRLPVHRLHGVRADFRRRAQARPQEADYYSVHGTFTEVSGWKSSSSGSDHACAYLIGRASGKLLGEGARVVRRALNRLRDPHAQR